MQLETVENYTPFTYFSFEKAGPGRRHFDVLICKAVCRLLPGEEGRGHGDGIELTAESAPLWLADEHYGAPERTSLRVAGDTVLHKPGTDLWVRGSVTAPEQYRQHWAVSVEVSGKNFKRQRQARLVGPRQWRWSFIKGWQLSEPEPAESWPLRYELAFGGRYPNAGGWIEHEPNPVGIGFFDARRMDREIHYPAPQIEAFDVMSERPGALVPVPGLGPIPRFWDARSRFAGTYDKAWQRQADSTAGPDYPADFDPRFFHAAHPDWVFERPLAGGEQLALRGFRGLAHCVGHLPAIRLEALLLPAKGQAQLAPMRLDTIDIDLDAERLYLTWRLPVPHVLQARHAVLRSFRLD